MNKKSNEKISNLMASIEEEEQKSKEVSAIEVTLEQLQTARQELQATVELYKQAKQTLESANANLVSTANTIDTKVNSINQKLDGIIEQAPKKLKVKVSVSDDDMKTMTKQHTDHFNSIKQSEVNHEKELTKLLDAYHAKNIEQAKSWGEDVRSTFRNYEGYYASGWVANVCAFFFMVGILCMIGMLGYAIASI